MRQKLPFNSEFIVYVVYDHLYGRPHELKQKWKIEGFWIRNFRQSTEAKVWDINTGYCKLYMSYPKNEAASRIKLFDNSNAPLATKRSFIFFIHSFGLEKAIGKIGPSCRKILGGK